MPEIEMEAGRPWDGALSASPPPNLLLVNPGNAPCLRATWWRGGNLFPADPISEMSVVVCWRHRVCALQAPALRTGGGGGWWWWQAAAAQWGSRCPPPRPVPIKLWDAPLGSHGGLGGGIFGLL